MLNSQWWIVISIYMICIFMSILILQAVDWGKIIRKDQQSTGMARALYFLTALALGSAVGTMFVIIASLPY